MKYKIEDFMDWPQIEDLAYGECKNPGEILGPLQLRGNVLVRCYFPEAKSVSVQMKKKGLPEEIPMELMDECGYFAAFLDVTKIPKYSYIVKYEDRMDQVCDVYGMDSFVDAMDEAMFEQGRHDRIYNKLGAHSAKVQGVKGTHFAVWAPNATSVSVVGDFNQWEGKKNPMRCLSTGIFELFVPHVEQGELYKYEIHGWDGKTTYKADPYGFYSEVRPKSASIVWDIDKEKWNDKAWMQARKNYQWEKEAMVVLELHMGSFRRPKDGREFYNYREMAPLVVEYCKDMGYTHIEMMPIMEHPLDASWGYQVIGYYAPTSRYGTPDDFQYFVNELHKANIGVILDWVPAHFPKDEHGLGRFDGTCLYEHLDPRQGEHPHWGTYIYNYGRPEVANYLYANILFWAEKYHIDGFRFDAVASMLYLDYGRQDGEWVANMYGGNENLQAIEFLQKVNSKMKEADSSVLMIAEESTAWPMVTASVEEGGLGFDLKWNMGWMNDYLEYIRTDPLFRKGRHGMLSFSMVYHYSEHFSLIFSHDEVVHEKGSMYQKMPGTPDEKMASLRLTYGYMMTHPGKNLLFMGQDFGQEREWNENAELDWDLLDNYQATSVDGSLVEIKSAHKLLQDYVKDLLAFYKSHPALYEDDEQLEGFQWVSMLDADHSVLAFMRNTEHSHLLVVCNFTPVTYDAFKLGVPYAGKYKEIWNSDAFIYGGKGNVNPRLKNAKKEAVDGMDHAIEFTLAPLSIQIFDCAPTKKAE